MSSHRSRATVPTGLPARAVAALVVVMLASGAPRAAAASGDDAYLGGSRVGTFPLLRVGALGGLADVPVFWTREDWEGQPYQVVDGQHGYMAGVDLHAHLDLDIALVNLQGVYNPLGGAPRWGARGQVVLAKGLGYRGTHNVVLSYSDRVEGGQVIRTTEYYANRKVPIFIGLSGGASLWSFEEKTYRDAYGTASTREAATVANVSAGFTAISPQFELMLEPTYEPANGIYGLRWAMGVAFPVGGDLPLWSRVTVDHVFGDDPADQSGRRASMIALMSLGIGTSMNFID